jgi:phosphoribosyl-ATP pyrophosphohydrolase
MNKPVDPRVLAEIWDVICSRAEHPTSDSYTSRLLTDR